jgi:hypothetical protein
LISHVNALREVKPAPTFESLREIKQFFKGLDRGELILPERSEQPEMPTTEPERSAEALRRALPQLISLNRYERRAAARRAHAMNTLLEHRGYQTMQSCDH